MRFLFSCLVLFCVACTKNLIAVHPEPEVLRSAEGYAIAYCIFSEFKEGQVYLEKLQEKYPFLERQAAQAAAAAPYLAKQAHAWGDAIVQTGRLRLDALADIALATQAEMAKGEMSWGQIDAPAAEAIVALPLRACADMVRKPAVRAVIDAVVANPKNILPPDDAYYLDGADVDEADSDDA